MKIFNGLRSRFSGTNYPPVGGRVPSEDGLLELARLIALYHEVDVAQKSDHGSSHLAIRNDEGGD